MSAEAHGIFSGQHLAIFGAGYIGLAVAHGALARGLRVTALTRNREKARALALLGAEAVSADLSDPAWHAKIPGRVDLVLNCVSSGGSGAEGYRRSYVDGMRSLLAWADHAGPIGTMVYTSSTSVYPQDNDARVDENAPTDAASETGQLLLGAEEQLRNSRAIGRWFILRLAGIYGPKRHHLLDQLCAGQGRMAGRGEHRLNLIHRDDAVSAIWAAFAAPRFVANEIFNVTDDAPAPKQEVLGWLAAQLDLPSPHFTGEPFSTRRPITPDRVILNQKIKTTLGWRPQFPDFRAGYRALLGA